MIIYLQYTICDTRRLKNKGPELLARPRWKNITPYRDFVRGSGQMIPRTRRGLSNWVGENDICRINKGIKVLAFKDPSVPYILKPVGKHQYSDGNFLTKYEFAFHLINDSINPENEKKEYSVTDLNSIIDNLLSCQIRIRNFEFKHDLKKVRTSDKSLEKFHIVCTTKKEFFNSQNDEDIQICIPQIFFHLEGLEVFNVSHEKVREAKTKTLIPVKICGWIESKNNWPYRIWVLQEGLDEKSSKNKDYSRNIRIALLRIHSEVLCIKQVLQVINEEIKEYSAESNLIQSFLNSSTRKIEKQKRKIINSTGIYNIDEFIIDVFDDLEPGKLRSIMEQVENLKMRYNIDQKAIQIINNYAPVSQQHLGDGDNVGKDKHINP